MSGLLFKVAPFRTEGILGYQLRLADTNGLSLSDVQETGVAFTPASMFKHGLLPEQAIDAGLWEWVGHLAKLRNDTQRIWNFRFSRFCAQCLTEDGSWRAEWELYFYDACHHHNVWMIDRCSSCGATVSWGRSELLRCNCGSDLRTEEGRIAPTELITLSAAISASLHRRGTGPVEILNGLNVDQIQRVVRFLGILLNPDRSHETVKVQNAGLLAKSWPITSFASVVLARWPEAFHECFSALQDAVKGRKLGLQRAIQRPYYHLYNSLKEPCFDPLRNEFQGWVAQYWRGSLALRNGRLAEHIINNVQWIPAKLASDMLGIQKRQVEQLVRDGSLEGNESFSSTGRRFLMVRRDQVQNLTITDITEINLTDAMSILGIGKIRMRELVRLLFPSAYRPFSAKGFPPWRIYRKDVESYLDVGQHLPVLHIPEESQISFHDVLKYWNFSDEEIIDLISAVKDGAFRLEAMLDGAVGMARWVFDRKKLKLWHQGRTVQSPNWMTVPAVAKMLGVKQEVAYWLVRNEFIRGEKLRPQTGVGARVSRQELVRFNESYVFATEIAEALQTTSRKVTHVLSMEGISPASGQGIEKCGKVFFARSPQLEEFLRRVKVTLPSRKI